MAELVWWCENPEFFGFSEYHLRIHDREMSREMMGPVMEDGSLFLGKFPHKFFTVIADDLKRKRASLKEIEPDHFPLNAL